jgi:hypothetical protein
MFPMTRFVARLSLVSLLTFGSLFAATVPTPDEFFGFRMGTDKKLARWDKIVEYLEKVGATSGRVHVRNLGPSTMNNPFLAVEITSEANMKNLDKLKALEQKLYFQNGAPTNAERDEIFRDGKAVVVITTTVHATEIGASQMVPEAVYKLATSNDPAILKILANTILVLVPSLNPDGQIMVTDWYNKYLGTKYEASPLPYLYHFYTGHDNNRDMYAFTQRESQMTAKLLWRDWYPSIWLDEHQQGSSAARIFTMPARDPINPNVHPLVYRLNGIYGQFQAAALEAEGKTGIIYNSTYTNFWQGAMAWSGWWHNEVGLLTEVASVRIATPIEQRKADPKHPAPPQPETAEAFESERRRMMEHPEEPLAAPRDITPRTEYPRPWMGGTWRLRDIVDYELTATFALLEAAADTRETLLHQVYDMNRATIEEGKKGEIGDVTSTDKTFAILIPAHQFDENESGELIDKLQQAGVDVYRAEAPFQSDKKDYAAGTYVIPMTQVFARYAKDMVEKQTYPEVKRAPNAPAEPPYDVSAWSLGMQFGVKTAFAKTALPGDLKMAKLDAAPKAEIEAVRHGTTAEFVYKGASSALVLHRLFKAGVPVSRNGNWIVAPADALEKAATGFELKMSNGAVKSSGAVPARAPRVAIYQSYSPSMDEGWTRWVLDHYEFPFTPVHNSDIQAGKLRARFDAIILPDERAKDIMEGLDYTSIVPEYRGGIGETGFDALKEFISEGGTVVALGEACNLLIDRLPLGVKDLKHTLKRDQHFAPGSILKLQVDTTHPLGAGMAPDTYGYYINSPFFELTEGFASQKATVAARYPNVDANASGWVRGEDLMLGRAAVVSIEMANGGKVVLFGIRPQHRAQTHATFPMLFNALYWSASGQPEAESAAAKHTPVKHTKRAH